MKSKDIESKLKEMSTTLNEINRTQTGKLFLAGNVNTPQKYYRQFTTTAINEMCELITYTNPYGIIIPLKNRFGTCFPHPKKHSLIEKFKILYLIIKSYWKFL